MFSCVFYSCYVNFVHVYYVCFCVIFIFWYNTFGVSLFGCCFVWVFVLYICFWVFVLLLGEAGRPSLFYSM